MATEVLTATPSPCSEHAIVQASRSARWVRTAAFGLAGALALLIVGDRGAAVTIQGIDPLEVLNLRVKPNILFVLDTSSTMRKTLEAIGPDVGGDDPNSRFYQAKLALRSAINANSNQANMAILAMGPANDKKVITHAPGGGPLTYVTANVEAAAWTVPALFTAASPQNFPVNYGTDATPVQIIASLNNSENGFSAEYPAGCTAAAPGTWKPANCHYYIKSRLFRSGQEIRFVPGNLASNRTVVVPTTCPLPPAGLTPDNPDADGNGFADQARPCFKLQEWKATGGSTPVGNPAIFYYTSAQFGLESAPSCGGTVVNGVPDCTTSNTSELGQSLGLEIPDTSALTAGSDLTNTKPKPAGAGIRVGGNGDETPIAASLGQALSHFQSVLANRPAAVLGQQKNFVVLITDGNESCSGDAVAAAKALYDNTNPSNSDADRVETIVIALTDGPTVSATNAVALAGSGDKRGAFRARTAAELEAALGSAITDTLINGTFSDQQSITESVFEFVATVTASPSPGPSPTTSPADPPNPLNPFSRYSATVPLLMQSTFDMPGFKGHLKAFRNDGSGNPIPAWGSGTATVAGVTGDQGDAGFKLYHRVVCGTNQTFPNCGTDGVGTPPVPPASGTTKLGGEATYAELNGTVPAASPFLPGGLIKRRVFTSLRNGVFPYNYSSSVSPDTVGTAGDTSQYPALLWPNAGTATTLDAAMGIAALLFADMQKEFGACTGTLAAGHACLSATLSTRTNEARKESRQTILAFMAGAQISRNDDGSVRRDTSGNLLYKARDWVLAESTLAAPAVVTPPLESKPSVHVNEYAFFRDGPRATGNVAVNGISQGFGLRNPDKDATSEALTAPKRDTSRPALKPILSVVYHAANDGVHALRAGPNCEDATTCTEMGGEELWMFVPFDQLGKLRERLRTQSRDNHTYMIAAPVRVSDIFVGCSHGGQNPGCVNLTISGASVTGDGRWRTAIWFGRGIAGKSITALDVTAPGPFTTAYSGCSYATSSTSLCTAPPFLLWSRGNPDTQNGVIGGTSNRNAGDETAYATMGETWSVPAISAATATANVAPGTTNGSEFVAYVGSGFGSTPSEGSTFYVLDAINGNVIRSVDVGERSSGPGFENALVGSPAGFNPGQLVEGFVGNPSANRITRIYIGDIHGRLWRFMADQTLTATTPFADFGANQPIGTGVALMNLNNGGFRRPHIFVESGHDRRVTPSGDVPPFAATPPFNMWGLRDDGNTSDPDSGDGVSGPARVLFTIPFPNNPAPGFRGTVQPATVFSRNEDAVSGAVVFLGRVFFAGSQFTPAGSDCLARFDSLLFAVGAVTGGAAYDLDLSGTVDSSDRSILLSGQKVQAIRSSGGRLVVDVGLQAQNAPPPPAPPAVLSLPSGAQNDVFIVGVRGNTAVCR